MHRASISPRIPAAAASPCTVDSAVRWASSVTRYSASSRSSSTSSPVAANEVAVSTGRSARVMSVFTPAPITTASGCPGTTSARMPLTLPPSRSTSFGHLSPALWPVPRSWPITARVIAAPAISGIHPRARTGSSGTRTSTETARPVPGGAVHVRSRRPRPSRWSVVRTTDRCGHCSGDAAAPLMRSALVDPVDSVTCRRGETAAERGYPSSGIDMGITLRSHGVGTDGQRMRRALVRTLQPHHGGRR